jgi:outer membrane protein TolC
VGRLTQQVAARSRAGEESGLAARRLALAEAELRAGLAQAEASAVRARAVARAWRPDLDPGARPARLVLPAPSATDVIASPGLVALQHDTEQARFEERLSSRVWAFPELQFGWQRLAVAGGARTGPVFGAGMVVPVFDRNKSGRLESAARREAVEARLALETARFNAQLAGAREAYAGLVAAALRAEDVAADSDRVVEAATAAFRAGEASMTDLLDTLRAAREAQTRALDMQAAALAAQRQLEAVSVGVPEGGLR